MRDFTQQIRIDSQKMYRRRSNRRNRLPPGPSSPRNLLHIQRRNAPHSIQMGHFHAQVRIRPPWNTPQYFSSLAWHTYSPLDVSASPSSGSFKTDSMIVVPCTMKTLARICIGYKSDLIVRAASVTLKERRRLVRETPLSSIHLSNMLEVTREGQWYFPQWWRLYETEVRLDALLLHVHHV